MSIPAWPVALFPATPQQNTYTETKRPNRISFEPNEAAPPKVRRRFTSAIAVATWRRLFTQDQLELFWDFYESTLMDGTLKFTLKHPIFGTPHTWRFAPGFEPTVNEQDRSYFITIELLRLD